MSGRTSVIAITMDISDANKKLEMLKNQSNETLGAYENSVEKAIGVNKKYQTSLKELEVATEKLGQENEAINKDDYLKADAAVKELTQSTKELYQAQQASKREVAGIKTGINLDKDKIRIQEQRILKLGQETDEITKQENAINQHNIAQKKSLKTALDNHNARKKESAAIKQANQALKDKLLITSKAEQIERKYKNLIKLATEARKKEIISVKELAKAKKNLNAQMLQEVAMANRATGSRSRMINDLVRHVRMIETLVVSLYLLKSAWDKTLGVGHEFNKLIERETIGLKLLISQNLARVDSEGAVTTAMERYSLAQQEANKAIEIARKINLSTPHSFAETLQIFKLLTPQVLKLGGSLEEVGVITQRMSVIAASMGIEYQQFLKTVDSALSGEMKESGLKRALEQFGVTNEGIKEIKKRNGDVISYVINGLEQAEAAGLEIFDSWAGATSQFKNEWDDLWGEIQKPLFEAWKEEIKDFSKYLKENKEDILDTVDSVVWLTKKLFTLGTAYLALKVYGKAMAYLTEMQKANALVTANNIASQKLLGIAVAGNTSLIRTMALSLKSLAVTALPLAAVYVAFEALLYITGLEDEALDHLNKTLNLTIIEFGRLDKVLQVKSMRELNEALDESDKKLESLRAALDYTKGEFSTKGAVAFTLETNVFDSMEEREESLVEQIKLQREHNAEIVDQITLLRDIPKELQNAIDLNKIAISKSDELDKKWLEVTDKVRLLSLEHKTVNEKYAQYLLEQYKAKENAKDQVKITGELVDELGGVKRAVYGVNDGLADGNAQLKAMVSNAITLEKVLLAGRVARGSISEKGALTEQYSSDMFNVEGADEAGQEAILTAKYQNDLLKINTKLKKENVKTERTLNSLKVANLELTGKDTEALQLKIDMINKEEIPDSVKLAKIANLRLQAEQKLTKATGGTTKGAKETGKAVAETTKELEELYKKYLEMSGKDLELFYIDIDKTMNDMMRLYEAHKITAEQIGELYNILYDDIPDKAGESGDDAGKEFSDSFGNAIESLLDGDGLGALTSTMDGVREAMGIDTVGEAWGNVFSGILNDTKTFAKDMEAALVSTGWYILLKVGLELLNSLGSTVSEADLDLAKGVTVEMSDSVNRSLDNISKNSTTGLKYSSKMARSLQDLVNLSDKAAANLPTSLSGADYIPRQSESFGASSATELLASGIDLSKTSIAALNDGYLDASMYITERFTSSKVFGLINSDEIRSYSAGDLDTSVVDAITEAFISGIDALESAYSVLGGTQEEFERIMAGWETIEAQLNLEGMDAQGMSDMLAGYIAANLDVWTDSLDTMTGYIDEFKLVGENSFATYVRLANDYEVMTREMGKMGLVMDDVGDGGLRMSEALIDAAGGIDSFVDKLSFFYDNFYTDAERTAMYTKILQAEYANLNITMPTTVEGMKQLVELKYIEIQALANEIAMYEMRAEAAWAFAQTEYDALRLSLEMYNMAQAEYAHFSNWMVGQKARLEAMGVEIDAIGESLPMWVDTFGNIEDVTSSCADAAAEAEAAAEAAEDAAQAATEAYRSLHTDAQQAAFAVMDLNTSFKDLGYAVPTSAEDFIKLVDGIDTSTEAGVKLRQELLAIAPAFLSVADSTKAAADTATASYRSLFSDADQARFAVEDLTKEFAELGYAVPNTTDDFIDLVDGIDTSSEAGVELRQEILALADSFLTAADAAEALADIGRAEADAYYDMMLAEQKVIEQREYDAAMDVYNETVRAIDDAYDASMDAYDDRVKAMNDIYDDAMDVYNDTIAEMEKLIESLDDLSETLKDRIDYYANGAEDRVLTIADITSIIGEVYASPNDELVEITNKSISMIDDYYKQQTDIFNTLIDALDEIQDYVDKSRLETDSLMESQLDYKFYFARVASALENMESEEIGNLISLLTASADNYLELLKGTATNTAEYEYEKNVMLNQLEGMADSGDPLINAIEDLRIQTVAWLENIDSHIMAKVLQVTVQITNTTAPVAPAPAPAPAPPTYPTPPTPPTPDYQYTPNEQTVLDYYLKYLGVSANNVSDASLAYWTNELNVPGGVDEYNLGESLGAASVIDGVMSRADFVRLLYTYGFGRTASPAEVSYWAYDSLTPTQELANHFASVDATYRHFAEGGIVTSPTRALIGEAGYNEAVIPLKNPNDPLGQKELIKVIKEEMKEMRQEMKTLQEINAKTEKNTKPQRITA